MEPLGPKLPITKLPFLALETIYENLQFADLMNLSQCSKRMADYLISLEKSSTKPVHCDVSIRLTRRMIRLKRQGWEDFAWSSHSPRNKYSADVKVFIDRVINGVHWRVSPWKFGWMTMGINDDHLLFWFEYFKKVFDCRIDHLELEIETNVDFEKLFINSDFFRTADKITVLSTVLRNEEMDFIFDNFEAGELIMNGTTRRGYRYPGVISAFAKIQLPKVTWLTINDIWQMAQSGCRQMIFNLVPVTSALINQFIKDWLASDNTTLETIRIRHSSACLMGHNPVFRGITVRPGARKRRDAAQYYNPRIHYENGRDVERQDGVLATVNIVSRGAHRGFYFTVWYGQNPNVQ